jgi:hypothetical protein
VRAPVLSLMKFITGCSQLELLDHPKKIGDYFIFLTRLLSIQREVEIAPSFLYFGDDHLFYIYISVDLLLARNV